MKNILVSFGMVLAAILMMVSAGCFTSSGNNASAVVPAVTMEKSSAGIPAMPFQGPVTNPPGTAPADGGNGDNQRAAKGDTVAVYYTGTFENGTIFDSNMNATKPVAFTLGNSSVIPGFEEAVTGMSVNQQKTVLIPAIKAYGVYNASLIRTVNRTGPIANTTFTKGQFYSIHDRTTNAVSVIKILDVTPTTITFDSNDPLAGLNFTFTIKLAGITRP